MGRNNEKIWISVETRIFFSSTNIEVQIGRFTALGFKENWQHWTKEYTVYVWDVRHFICY